MKPLSFHIKYKNIPNAINFKTARASNAGVVQKIGWELAALTKPLVLVWCRSLVRGLPAQVSPLSSDRGSKLRGPSQNRLRVASKWNVNIKKN
ncbi:hypothetical protein AVEN_252338-1 [Araneus ventricosus]|uniref:Uncharacterized protein n=1 Tax=Araneus ventricosus TaxID=182803 RepID=A0A4Y2AR12_ARAVE|nr:hypothetical protein AVEN_252338-1 [Araneus ventricosus]